MLQYIFTKWWITSTTPHSWQYTKGVCPGTQLYTIAMLTHCWRNRLSRPTISTGSATVLELCWLECVLKQNKTKLGTVMLMCTTLKFTLLSQWCSPLVYVRLNTLSTWYTLDYHISNVKVHTSFSIFLLPLWYVTTKLIPPHSFLASYI